MTYPAATPRPSGVTVIPGTLASAVKPPPPPTAGFATSLPAMLADELERVIAKRERWRAFGVANDVATQLEPAIAIMTAAIDTGKAMLAEHDAMGRVAALRSLQRFDDDG